MNKTLLTGICMILLVIAPIYAEYAVQETSSLSRIVGESLIEMLMQRNEIETKK